MFAYFRSTVLPKSFYYPIKFDYRFYYTCQKMKQRAFIFASLAYIIIFNKIMSVKNKYIFICHKCECYIVLKLVLVLLYDWAINKLFFKIVFPLKEKELCVFIKCWSYYLFISLYHQIHVFTNFQNFTANVWMKIMNPGLYSYLYPIIWKYITNKST